jgi:hypothetical protein
VKALPSSPAPFFRVSLPGELRTSLICRSPFARKGLFGADLLTATILILLPGPDMLFALATGIKSVGRAGCRRGLPAAAGKVVHITTAGSMAPRTFQEADEMELIGHYSNL